MKKFINVVVFLLGISLIMTACSTKKNTAEPKISLKFIVSDLSEEEFQSVGTAELIDPAKEDFKKLEFKLDVEHSNKITNRKITKPDFRAIINSQESGRYWFGESSRQDNKNDTFASYGDQIVFYAKGLNEKAIKEIFKAAEVNISWTTAEGQNQEKVFNLGDVVEFK